MDADTPSQFPLDRPTKVRIRQLAVKALLRGVLLIVTLLVVYYSLPFEGDLGLGVIGMLVIGTVGFGAMLWWQVTAIMRSPHPVVRGIDTLVLALAVVIIGFASMYYAMSVGDTSAFTEDLSRTGSLYFTVTVFSTVGFGDITPVTDSARVVTMFQMLADLAVIGAGVRLLTAAVRHGSMERDLGIGRDRAASDADREP